MIIVKVLLKQLYTKRIKEPSEGGIETAYSAVEVRSKVSDNRNKFNSEDYE
jgi:hypothetical protein